MSSDTAATPVTSSEVPPPSPHTQKQLVVAVFCGASSGTSPAHLEAARSLAHALHHHNATLIYGGGTTGVMGEIAKTLVSLSGPQSVHGIIPEPLLGLERPRASGGEDERIYGPKTIVDTMHTRKALMAKEVAEGGPGSGFVALSGGFGTLDELFEMTTWNQLGIHAGGLVAFNVDNYYDDLFAFIKKSVPAGFITPANSGILVEARDVEEVMTQLKEYKLSENRLQLKWDQK
ncbi:MAG: hypothetical protein L6R40_007564 [Gallowayella cf. fulva]|nr:MAG: hypothetical protein L6R40_007564 [Xanthomendoza cf. fulva]